jgi:hypothetical protein
MMLLFSSNHISIQQIHGFLISFLAALIPRFIQRLRHMSARFCVGVRLLRKEGSACAAAAAGPSGWGSGQFNTSSSERPLFGSVARFESEL